MVVNGSEIVIFDDFEIGFGEALVFTENRLARRKKHAKKEYNSENGNLTLVIKNVSLCGVPGKCCLEYDKKNKLCAVRFRMSAADYRACSGPDDTRAAANDFAAFLVGEMHGVLDEGNGESPDFEGISGSFKLSVCVSEPSFKVNVTIAPAN